MNISTSIQFHGQVPTTQHNTAAAAAKTKEFDHREEVALIIFVAAALFEAIFLAASLDSTCFSLC